MFIIDGYALLGFGFEAKVIIIVEYLSYLIDVRF